MEVLFSVDYLNVLGNDLLKQESAVSEQGIIGYSLVFRVLHNNRQSIVLSFLISLYFGTVVNLLKWRGEILH